MLNRLLPRVHAPCSEHRRPSQAFRLDDPARKIMDVAEKRPWLNTTHPHRYFACSMGVSFSQVMPNSSLEAVIFWSHNRGELVTFITWSPSIRVDFCFMRFTNKSGIEWSSTNLLSENHLTPQIRTLVFWSFLGRTNQPSRIRWFIYCGETTAQKHTGKFPSVSPAPLWNVPLWD